MNLSKCLSLFSGKNDICKKHDWRTKFVDVELHFGAKKVRSVTFSIVSTFCKAKDDFLHWFLFQEFHEQHSYHEPFGPLGFSKLMNSHSCTTTPLIVAVCFVTGCEHRY